MFCEEGNHRQPDTAYDNLPFVLPIKSLDNNKKPVKEIIEENSEFFSVSDNLQLQVKFLQNKLNSVRWFALMKANGEIIKYSTKQRGNHAYARDAEEKLSETTEKMKEVESEALFLTLTYGPKENGRSIIGSWKKAIKELRKFKRKLKSLGYIYQVGCNEATEKGYFHAHILIKDKGSIYKKWYDKKNKCWRLSDENLRQELKSKWSLGFLDIVVVKEGKNSDEAYEYIRKYCGKFGNIEETIKRVARDSYDDTKKGKKQKIEDTKKIRTHYYASKSHCRLFFYTRNLSAIKWIKEVKRYTKELSDEIVFNVLFCHKNNVTSENKQKHILLTKDITNSHWFIHEVGYVVKDSLEWYHLMELFDKVAWRERFRLINKYEGERLAEKALYAGVELCTNDENDFKRLVEEEMRCYWAYGPICHK